MDGHRPWSHAGGGWNKDATAIPAYTITSSAPSYQLLRPSETTAATTAVAKTKDASSKISKSRVMTFAVRRETKTRIGATNNATWVVDVVATATLSSILFLQAMRIALPCSAALPTMATPERMPVESTYKAGITRPMTATTSIVIWIPDASREKCCTLYFTPPANMLNPRTKSRFPTTEPVSDAFTTSVKPRDRAKIAMMSSVAFPNVAFRRPPTPGPACFPSSSVARPRNQASGTMARPATAKTMTPGPRSRSRIQLSGTKSPNRSAQVYARNGSRSIAPRNVQLFLTPRATFN